MGLYKTAGDTCLNMELKNCCLLVHSNSLAGEFGFNACLKAYAKTCIFVMFFLPIAEMFEICITFIS